MLCGGRLDTVLVLSPVLGVGHGASAQPCAWGWCASAWSRLVASGLMLCGGRLDTALVLSPVLGLDGEWLDTVLVLSPVLGVGALVPGRGLWPPTYALRRRCLVTACGLRLDALRRKVGHGASAQPCAWGWCASAWSRLVASGLMLCGGRLDTALVLSPVLGCLVTACGLLLDALRRKVGHGASAQPCAWGWCASAWSRLVASGLMLCGGRLDTALVLSPVLGVGHGASAQPCAWGWCASAWSRLVASCLMLCGGRLDTALVLSPVLGVGALVPGHGLWPPA
ncbi:hypothetical protein niasHT_027741 [Heterodera trifolii]|uniref:Uncharacterized protein n=1 Tax=Heterodera trifolii TaxID=157864 RepID=A0ABD2KIS6_9BILA